MYRLYGFDPETPPDGGGSAIDGPAALPLPTRDAAATHSATSATRILMNVNLGPYESCRLFDFLDTPAASSARTFD
ncbi:hypothetical protein GCM10009855_16820 [Gordonia cholesterolivorans]|uniref:Uncharacterized protein n=1 Tax=Gordonia cholesterolivorans TaxID=559625 RepID=A0ABP5UEC0_9ACTN